ncbi:hypothetical protein RU98_GL003258 [Enterococcus caccae]|nr:hypothetical protein RU98_GL003258 [Enterococcus caccae]
MILALSIVTTHCFIVYQENNFIFKETFDSIIEVRYYINR